MGWPGGRVFMSRDSATKKNEQILSELLKEEPNRQCADCGQKGSMAIAVCLHQCS